MYESGYYPAGAEFDPRAPWNEREPTMVECAACGGKGYHWYAYDFEADYETECSEEVWNMLPETEEEAEAEAEDLREISAESWGDDIDYDWDEDSEWEDAPDADEQPTPGK